MSDSISEKEIFPPKWFSLEKYIELTANATNLQWLKLLGPRSLLWRMAGDKPFLSTIEIPKKTIAEMLEEVVIQSINIEDRLETFYDQNAFPMIIEFESNRVSVNRAYNKNYVTSADIGELSFRWWQINQKDSVKPHSESLARHANMPSDTKVDKELEALLKTPIDEVAPPFEANTSDAGSTLVSVYLGASDDILVEDFKKWLSAYRNHFKADAPRKQFSEKTIEGWVNNRVLAYLDLALYCKVHDLNPTYQQIGHHLFPDDYEVNLTDRVRRTVKPLAEEVIAHATIKALATQCLKEMGTRQP